MYSNNYKVPESQQQSQDVKTVAPSVHIHPDVYRKIMFWIDKAPGEVSGMGKVVYDVEKNVFRVIEAYLLKQKNTGASTELDATAIAQLLYETRNDVGELRWWWHSHVNMPVFWSGTDMSTIADLSQGGWILSTVLNKKRDMLSSFCQVAPVMMFVNQLQTSITTETSPELEKQWSDEYDQKCTIEKVEYTQQSFWNNNRNNQQSNLQDNGDDDLAVSMSDVAGYVDMFGADNVPPDLQELFPEYNNGVPDFENSISEDAAIKALEERGYVFDNEDADEDIEARSLDVGPVQHKSWKDFNGRDD